MNAVWLSLIQISEGLGILTRSSCMHWEDTSSRFLVMSRLLIRFVEVQWSVARLGYGASNEAVRISG